MSPVRDAAIAILTLAGLAHAAPPAAPPPAGDAAIEPYLERPGLQRLLAEHLAQRVKHTTGAERADAAARLGKLYVEFISKSKDDAERQTWERRAQELLRLVPEVQSLALRVEVAKAAYPALESQSERWRLRLIDDTARADTERQLRELQQTFEQLANEGNRRVETLERQEEAGRISEKLTEELAEARRLRSITNYYAGWCGVYLAMLTDAELPAQSALKSFAWLLTAGNGPRIINLDRLDRRLLKFDHLARAAVGVAIARSQLNNDAEALRWLAAIADEPESPAEVRAQLLSRRIDIYARARRFTDIERDVRLARQPPGTADPNALPKPLDTLVARLLCVRAFEAQAKDKGPLNQNLSLLTQIGMQDLVARGEVGHVLDLATRFGTAPLGDEGFIVYYVRGVRLFDDAEKTQRAAGADPDRPATDPAVINLYRQSIAGLDAAAAQPDATRYPRERARCLITAGRALLRVGEPSQAADRLADAAATAGDPAIAEDALWQAIVALDHAATTQTTLEPRLNELCVLYVRQHPQSERAASLIVKRPGQTGLSEAEATAVLMSIGRDSTIYEAARRQAARLLYRAFRAASEAERDFAAQRFVRVGLEVLAFDQRVVGNTKATREALEQAVERLVVTARQVLDAMLAVSAPDGLRATALIDNLEALARGANVDLSPQAAELAFRRVQAALAREDEPAADAAAANIRGLGEQGPRFADAAARALYQRALNRWRRPEAATDPAAARAVTARGERLLGSIKSADAADQGVLALRRQLAEAYALLWHTERDEAARDAAIGHDKAILAAVPGVAESLTRLAELSESAGDAATALESHTTLVNGLAQGTPEWFRARYHSLRLLAKKDPQAAADEFAVYLVLYPDFGPEPFGGQLRAVHATLPPPAANRPAAAEKGGGG